MLISRVEDEAERRPAGSDAHEYQTADELFDLMAKDHPFEDVNETLSTRDLVILYKNIDLGAKLMSNSDEYSNLSRRPNQRVETVVYDDADSESEAEPEPRARAGPSLQHTLCQKLGDLDIQTSNLSFQYNQHFLFKDPYIKQQLKTLSQIDGEFNGSPLPASLLDYICCKRLEDNYNFYMDNIIRYVKHTIEQLKRISNGDYLTDRAKEKWKEVEDLARVDDHAKVLATSTSIPLQVERKVNGRFSTWDDIIHSEVDVRSLSKILEKKIIVEVPKLICGSYKLFSKMCSDNLVIRCKREQQQVVEKEKESRVDVVLQLGRSDTGQVVSNISSIMILQPTPPIIPVECPQVLPLQYNHPDEPKIEKKKVKIVEIPEIKEEIYDAAIEEYGDDDNMIENEEMYNIESPIDDIEEDANYLNESKNESLESGDSNIALKDILDTRAIPDVMRKEAPYNFLSPDDLSLSMHKLNMGSLPEEASEDMNVNPVTKKKSSTKARVKSPYENKSHMIDEKKRKKLLEIREKREKKKLAIGENCKITKHRYGKGSNMPQSSSSVTRLSITNKSFYNSIYGQNLNLEQPCAGKSKGRRGRRDLSLGAPLDNLEGEIESPMLTPEKNSKKYVNRSYYLDDAVTEMMYTEVRRSECSSARDLFSGSASVVSADFSANMNIISQIMDSARNRRENSPCDENDCFYEKKDFQNPSVSEQDESRINIIDSSRSILSVPQAANSAKGEEYEESEESKKVLPTVECRKSIEKVYDLMKKIRKDPLGVQPSCSKLFGNMNKSDQKGGQECSTVQGSDSGTSVKHHLTSSNPSSFSFEKIPNTSGNTVLRPKKPEALTTVVPKVIISTKQQPLKIEVEKVRKERKRVNMNPLSKVPDNPLQAISQLLHEFDSVQKTRHKAASEAKVMKKAEISFENKIPTRPGSLKRRSRVDQPSKDGRDRDMKGKEMREIETTEAKNVKVFFAKERRPKLITAMELQKMPHQQMPVEDRLMDRAAKKKIADMLDEVKEAKGEAVRGPSKPTSRLNTLAQPKKSYVQAHSEEYQTKYGRNLMADRLQRLATAPTPRGRPRPRSDAPSSSVSVKPPPPMQPLERAGRPRRSASSSPEGAPPAPPPASDAPSAMKTKMVAVESYVKNHYGRAPPAGTPNDVIKARVPLVPNDLDIASVMSSPTGEESAVIGSKLHHIISMMNPKPPPLAALLEAHEASSRPSREPDAYSLSLDNYSHGHASSIDSDYRADIFKDKNVETAVQDSRKEPDDDFESDKYVMKFDKDSCNSSMELQKLEEALSGRMPAGTFQKRLRIKNLTLTPKHSMRQLMVVESGDAGAIVLKSSVSKCSKMSGSHSDNDLRTLANLGNAHLDWRFSSIPVQVATVGYAFPKYKAALCGPSPPLKSLDDIISVGISVSGLNINNNPNKTSQCFKGVSQSQLKHGGRDAPADSENDAERATMKPLPTDKKQLVSVSVATDVHANHVVEGTCRDCAETSDVNKSRQEVDKLNLKSIQDSVDCTSSLDMLVGLLNEIQKITTCHMTNTEIYADEQECNELATLLNTDAALEALKNSGSRELVSIASLDKLRQLESSNSIYSLYLSNDERDSDVHASRLPKLKASAKSLLYHSKPVGVDKEVSADFPVRELTNTFTDVPSAFFPITITHSTNMTNSLVGILSKPSSQTVISRHDYDILESTLNCKKKIVEITEQNVPDDDIFQEPMIKEYGNPIIDYAKCKKQIQKCKVVTVKKLPMEVHKKVSEINLFSDAAKCCVKNVDFDPMMKVKRDLLVTMYSMLVLTVFAALSFPEMLYHV